MGKLGTWMRVSGGDRQGALLPGQCTRVPPGRGAERGRKWEEIGDDTTGLPPPPLAGGTLYITAPLPEIHDPHPTTRLKQEVGGDEDFVTQIT